MPGRMSNRERIARLAAEKAAEKRERKEKKKVRKSAPLAPVGKTAEAPASGARRLVWVVCDHTGTPVKTYPYPERKAADAEAARLTGTKGKLHFVRNEKVPME